MEVDAQPVPTALFCPGRPTLLGWPQGLWRVLLICTIFDNGMGRIPMDWVGAVLMCGSRGPSLEGVWPRTLRTED